MELKNGEDSGPSVKIVLQARTDSKRLPAKSLLPVGGFPLAILCAKRLSSRGHEVVLATSSEAIDDALACQARENKIRVFRGSLKNVYERFVCCTASMRETDIVVRATADNPVPNGELVEMVVQDFLAAGTPYLGQESYQGVVPYGLLVEVFYAGALRKSGNQDCDAVCQEHVTSAMVPHGLVHHKGQFRFASTDPQPLRVTIDTLDDYCIAERAFRAVADPVMADWRTMLAAFRRFRAASENAS